MIVLVYDFVKKLRKERFYFTDESDLFKYLGVDIIKRKDGNICFTQLHLIEVAVIIPPNQVLYVQVVQYASSTHRIQLITNEHTTASNIPPPISIISLSIQ